MSLMTNSAERRYYALRPKPSLKGLQAKHEPGIEACSPFVQARHKQHTGRRSVSSFRLLPRLTTGRPPLVVSRDVRAARFFLTALPEKEELCVFGGAGLLSKTGGRDHDPLPGQSGAHWSAPTYSQ